MAAVELVVSEFVILAVVCFALIRYYKGNMVTTDVAVAVYLSWVLGFAGILLLPYDISVAVVDPKHLETLDKVWNFIYWSTFILAWIVLPLQMEYHNSGHFTFGEKIRDAIMKNVWMGVLACLAGVVYVSYMLVTSKGSLSQIIGFVKAMSNTYGILMITILMGNGLVGLPKRMWYYTDTERELNLLYMMASSVETSYQEARFELEDCEWDVAKLSERMRCFTQGAGNAAPVGPSSKGPSPEQIAHYVVLLQRSVTDFVFSGRSTSKSYGAQSESKSQGQSQVLIQDCKKVLVELHARLKQSHIRARASQRRWKHLVKQCEVAELALRNESSAGSDEPHGWCSMRTSGAVPATGDKVIDSMVESGISRCYHSVTHRINSIEAAKFLKYSCRSFSVICGLVSLTILWSELFMAAHWSSPVGYMMGAYSPQTDVNSVVIQAVSFLALSYMSICTYWSLFRLNLGWAYTLQGPQLSPPASLIFNGEYFSRLQFALGYNFLMLLNVPETERTSFNQLMSNMATVPVFGTSFTVYVPIVTILVSLMTVMNVNARVLRFVGVESEDLYVQSSGCTACWRTRTKVALNDEDQERYELGKKLVSSELRAESSSKTSLNTSSHSSKSRSGSRVSMDGSSVRSGSGLAVSDCSWLTSNEKDEAPYRDEEAEEDSSHAGGASGRSGDEKGFMCFFTDGAKNGAHRKTCSINNIKNQISPMTSTSSASSHSLIHSQSQLRSTGMMQLPHTDGEGEEVVSSLWTNGLVSKFQDVFGISHNERDKLNMGLGAVPPLSVGAGASRDDLEQPGRLKSLFDRELRGLASTQPHYLSMRSAEYTSESTEGNFLESPDKKAGHDDFFRKNSLFGADKSQRSNGVNALLNARQASAANDNFGLDEEVAQPHGRRYANI